MLRAIPWKGLFVAWLKILGLGLLGSLLFGLGDWEVAFQARYYSSDQGWALGDETLPSLLYRLGTYPALALALTGLGLGLWRAFRPLKPGSWRFWLFFPLVMALGPGLLINGVLKKEWGRPRPRQLQQFGGQETYQLAGVPGKRGGGRASFPSGHAAMGFFLFTPFFLLRRQNPKLALAFLVLGLGFGALMGWARLRQGGHFLSDVFWSGLLVYLSALTVFHLLQPLPEPGNSAQKLLSETKNHAKY